MLKTVERSSGRRCPTRPVKVRLTGFCLHDISVIRRLALIRRFPFQVRSRRINASRLVQGAVPKFSRAGKAPNSSGKDPWNLGARVGKRLTRNPFRGHFPEAVFPKVQFGKFSCPKKVPRSCLGHLRDLIIERRLWPLGHICGPWATNGNREGRYVQKRQYDD